MFPKSKHVLQNKDHTKRIVIHFGLLFFFSLWISSCASPGNPDGGPYDKTPPRVVGSSPTYGSVNIKSKKIEINFDEYIKVDNATEKVIVSPPQLNMPEITTAGKRIKVNLMDSLKANTTYSIDFSDAIVDNNEGNPLGNYAFVFSTGDVVDSMEVSGTVLNAQNLEPVKGILVGLHSNMSDTAFTKEPLLRVARTNGSGHFIIKGVKPGKYKAYALQDADGDFRYGQKSEMLAFMDSSFTTSCFSDTRPDTIWNNYIKTRADSVRTVHFTHYKPDNIVLLAFLASGQERHLLKTVREVPEHFEIYFTAADVKTPRLRGINYNTDGKLLLEHSAGNDTLQYWISDTTLAYKDTLQAELIYNETDTLGKLHQRIDTLKLVSKVSHAKQLKWQANAEKDWQKQQEKLKKRNLPYDTHMPPAPLEVRYNGTTSLAPNENISFETAEPLVSIDTTKIHLYVRRDSVFIPANFLLKQKELSLKKYTLFGEWRPLQDYRLIVDSAAMISIYGRVNNSIKMNFSIPSLDKYSSLFLDLQGINDTTAVVQLLQGDKPVRTVRSDKGHAEFYFVKPGSYYLRLFIDRNGNGKWDPGDYEKKIQPEETYYFPTKLELRAMWDVSQNWNIRDVPVTKQKPAAITKQKPDKEKIIKNRNAEREKNKH